ncbi:cytochrome C oxidase subunit IV family protein [Paraconexibacter antarcticus]|uniref:Cytochrome C oxidase subunit IV family protein n=1 Tax=Paraconexibacter antarcticus TaxID=2949664 RepID=A0ABY5DP91_9ACTN|nr:cytochrome C oxidase subunit IV family protein [Paraconexibacter antarcticus]UTI63845.1 cytochrome C oxidase subunit IV family protein [Paraconexibacter antarcticus]
MTRAALLRHPVSVVWGILIAATLTSWWLGTDHGVSNEQTASILILVVAFIKVRFVGLYFMELRHAPLPLRMIFEGYCFVVCTTVILMFVIE